MSEDSNSRRKALNQSLVELLTDLLTSEKIVDAITQKVANRLESRGILSGEMKAAQFWEKKLKQSGLKLQKTCSVAKIVELFPLTEDEIEAVIVRIRTSKLDKGLDYALLKKFIIEQLGDDVLMFRSSMSKEGGREGARGYRMKRWTLPELDYEIMECYRPYMNMRVEADCRRSLLYGCMYPQYKYISRPACTFEYSCGQDYYCRYFSKY